MKKLNLFIACVMLILSLNTVVNAGERFVMVSIPCPESEELFIQDYQAYSRLLARYKDDKTPIPVSRCYDGYMYATIPVENKDREIEAFSADEPNFSDADTSFEYHIVKTLAGKGVILGNERNEARPYDNITRAEAVTIILRLMGIEIKEGRKETFLDVHKGDWYYDIVETAYEYGIAEGDDKGCFNPGRNVSREEMTALAARVIWSMEMNEENKSATREDILKYNDFADINEISDWALSAYDALKYASIMDFVEGTTLTDYGYEYEFMAYPKKPATRYDTADMIVGLLETSQIYLSQIAIEYGFDKAMPVIDGSTSTYPFTEAVYGNLFFNGYRHSHKPQSHSKSHASYQRLINGEVDMIFASVYPSSDIMELAEKNNVTLELIPIAYDAMIFFTNIDNPATNLTKEQISDIYVNNQYSDWSQLGGDNALLYPYCRNNDSGSHAQMERHFLNGREINEKIRNETTSVSMSNVLTDVMGARTDNPKGYGLGYSIYYYYKNMDPFYSTSTQLKLLSVDGVAPTDETIADGTYPLSNNTYIVLRSDEEENSPARRMAQFMLTEKGQECVEQAGFGRLN